MTAVNRLHPLISLLLAALLCPALLSSDQAEAESTSGIPQSEYAALYALYNSTGGDNWTVNTNWLSGFHAGIWHGITVENGHVTGVVLPSNNLDGTIPPELGNLTSLKSLMLESNRLSGEIPPELGDINTLLLLWLDGNSLSGDLPDFLENPPIYLDLRYNHLDASNQDVLAAVESAHSNAFRSTQTVPPANLTAHPTAIDGRNENRVLLTWDPISYVEHEGGYEVYFKPRSEQDYIYYGLTADKTVSSMTISDLAPGIEYDFMVRTVTRAHEYQKLIPS